MRDNLIRLHAFANNYQGQTSHTGVWKWAHDGRGPQIVVRRNRFLAFDAPHGRHALPVREQGGGLLGQRAALRAAPRPSGSRRCSAAATTTGDDGLCDGERMLALADCFSVVTKLDSESEADFLAAHWDPYVAAWKASHAADDE